MENYQFIKAQPFQDYCILTLNRPDKRNALSRAMRNELIIFLQEETHQFKAVILTGAGKGFCAGMDLKEKPTGDDAWHFWEVAKGIYQSNAIFIAAVNGAARGGGLTLVNACDLALASEQASFGMPEITFGGYPALVGPTTQLATLKKAVAWMVLTGQAISPKEAKEYGLINQIVTQETLLYKAKELAAYIATLDSTALQQSKKALNQLPYDDVIREKGIEMGVKANEVIIENR